MRKVMIILLIFGLILGSSCSNSNNSQIIETPVPLGLNGENPGEIDIFFPLIETLVPSDDYILKWQLYMKEKNNLDISLKYTKVNSSSDIKDGTADTIGVNTSDIERNESQGGFIYLDSYSSLSTLFNSGLIISVNEYIKNIPSMNTLNDRIIGQYSDESGNIWAIPLYHKIESSHRLYNGDWLAKWDKGIPETVGEFYNYAQYIKNGDPDKNGEDDSYIQMFQLDFMLGEFKDIFRAFGCYPPSGKGSVGYNPLEEKYENVLLNENFPEAFTLIKNMYDEGLIIRTYNSVKNRANEPFYVASARADDYSALKECDEVLAGYYLKGINEEKLISVSTGARCFVVLEGTENVEGKIEYLINKIKEEQEVGLDLSCGIKGESYYDKGDYYEYFYIDENNERVPRISILTAIESNMYYKKPILVSRNEMEINPELMIKEITDKANFATESSTYYDSELAYSLSFLKQNELITDLNHSYELNGLTLKTLQEMLDGEISIEDGIQQYRDKLSSSGFIDKIESINESIYK